MIIKIISIIFSLTGIAFIAKIFGEKNAESKQKNFEMENANENIKINKASNSMSFDDKSNFLLSKQKNRSKADK
jgi:hypothetical protein